MAAWASGLIVRPLDRADAHAFVAVVQQIETDVLGEPLIDLDDVTAEWSVPGFVPADHGRVVEKPGEFGAVLLTPRGRVELALSPGLRTVELTVDLLAWADDLAAAQGHTRIEGFVVGSDHVDQAAFDQRGFAVGHTSWILRLAADVPLALSPLPAGVTTRSFSLPDAEEVYRVVENAFASWGPSWRPRTFEQWAAITLDRPRVDPSRFRVAEDSAGRIIGAVVAFPADDSELWVEQLAVDSSWRGRGIGRRLLAEAFTRGRDDGFEVGGLATDSRTGALPLYESVGMVVHHHFTNRYTLLTGGSPSAS